MPTLRGFPQEEVLRFLGNKMDKNMLPVRLRRQARIQERFTRRSAAVGVFRRLLEIVIGGIFLSLLFSNGRPVVDPALMLVLAIAATFVAVILAIKERSL